MISKKLTPRRYQLKKEALQVLQKGHPWIFRSHLSSASEVFETGDWLSLVDQENRVVGYGIYDSEGLIGIRILRKGSQKPDMAWIKKTIATALKKRENLRLYSNAFRAIHGENDLLPGIVFDAYASTGVLQTYSAGVDTLGRYVAQILHKELGLENIIWKIPTKRKGPKGKLVRVLYGSNPGKLHFLEGKMKFTVDIGEGQKSGTFLDLRALRKWVAAQKLQGKKVLNLFSYTGTLGLAAEMASAKEIWNVDISAGALSFAKNNHTLNVKKHQFIEADIFKWIGSLNPKERFDFIIVDPPNMASKIDQVAGAMRAYKQIYKALLPHLSEKGTLIACCCTSRIERRVFRYEVDRWLSPRLKCIKSLNHEDDHPIGFPEGDYLKILIYSPKQSR